MATSPPRGRQEERNEQSCEGPECDPRRAVSGCAEQGRLLRAGLTRFLWRAPIPVAHVTSSTLRAGRPGLGRTTARCREPGGAGSASRHGERGRAARAARVAICVLLDDLHLAPFTGLDLHCSLRDCTRAA